MEHEDLHDVLDSEMDMDTENEESMVEEENNNEESNAEIETEDVEIKKPKGEDIYVENDISNLERMLGISSTDDSEDSTIDADYEVEEEGSDDEEELNKDSVFDDELKDDNNDSPTDSDSHSDKEANVVEEPVEDNKSKVVKTKPVLFSDFMDRKDSDSFTFLERNGGSYTLITLGLENKKAIQKAVRSPNYIFRYPKFVLRDTVLGFVENKKDSLILYTVYFPEYSLSFTVSADYQKPYSQSFKEYFEDLITRIRPMNMRIDHYNNSVTITSLKVLETGLLELDTTMGTEKYLLNNNDISFYSVLDYIRTLSDQGMDKIKLPLIPEFFVLV